MTTNLQAAAKYVLVPADPTEEMLDAGRDAGDFHIMHYDGTDKPGTPRYSLRSSWDAMIAAAPASEGAADRGYAHGHCDGWNECLEHCKTQSPGGEAQS